MTVVRWFFILVAVVLFGYMVHVEIHGRTAEIEEGKLHEDCETCRIYRTLNMDNAEFQLREMNRKVKQ